jgi:hypothetical protein
MITDVVGGSTETATAPVDGGGGGVLLAGGGGVLFPPPQPIAKIVSVVKTRIRARYQFLIFIHSMGEGGLKMWLGVMEVAEKIRPTASAVVRIKENPEI